MIDWKTGRRVFSFSWAILKVFVDGNTSHQLKRSWYTCVSIKKEGLDSEIKVHSIIYVKQTSIEWNWVESWHMSLLIVDTSAGCHVARGIPAANKSGSAVDHLKSMKVGVIIPGFQGKWRQKRANLPHKWNHLHVLYFAIGSRQTICRAWIPLHA